MFSNIVFLVILFVFVTFTCSITPVADHTGGLPPAHRAMVAFILAVHSTHLLDEAVIPGIYVDLFGWFFVWLEV